mgnify:CR=1 FL=1
MKKNKINWAQKLSSRKFWAALAGLVSSLLVFFNVPENQIAQISSIIGAVGVLAIYILAEAYVDANRVEVEETFEVEEKEK